jgi:hypothetical protein
MNNEMNHHHCFIRIAASLLNEFVSIGKDMTENEGILDGLELVG